MDKTHLVQRVATLFRVSGHKVDTSVEINHREIDIRAEETQGLTRKIILVECADYARNVGIQKFHKDVQKLRMAKEILKDNAIIMHVASNGYTPQAIGYANDIGIPAFTVEDLTNQLVNFDKYIEEVENEKLRKVILQEYQPNKIYYEGRVKEAKNSISFLDEWLNNDSRWLTILGDYGVGKSWTLKRYSYELIERYKQSPQNNPLPMFVALQRFTKSFDFENLILRTFQLYGLSGVHYSAFQYLMREGKIIFLLDSFDEMAQHLARETIRENLKEMLMGISNNCRAIMTSRPSYFEGRAERLLIIEKDGAVEWHPLDITRYEHMNALSRSIKERLEKTQFARINDLTIDQRKKLFQIVLGDNPTALRKLMELLSKFHELENLSQRAVIARLLTTVAETLASGKEMMTIEGYPLIPEDLATINQSKIFEIVIYNLLYRDENIGGLSASNRLRFLRNFALFLQQPKRDFFASPEELRKHVTELFKDDLRRTDAPEQLLENYYRTCRRHSGLTTEGQFKDTTGQIDMPVDEQDIESRVGFSHNSIREYLVSDSLLDYIRNNSEYINIDTTIVTDLVGDFMFSDSEIYPELKSLLAVKYKECKKLKLKDVLFKLIYRFIQKDARKNTSLLGEPPNIEEIDISGLDLSGIPLSNANIIDCVAQDTDFRKSDLRGAIFKGSVLEGIMLDEALLEGADFREADIVSLCVFDKWGTRTSSILKRKAARQWLFSHRAKVYPDNDLNILLGQPWYEAAREVTRTLEKQLAGTHQDVSLIKGTKLEYRPFAKDFVKYLKRKGILKSIMKSKTGPGEVVKVVPKFRDIVIKFTQDGIISDELKPFFDKQIDEIVTSSR